MMWLKRLITILGALLLSGVAYAGEPDWSAYAELLHRYVSQGSKHGIKLTLVDYGALKKSGTLESVYRQISTFPTQQLVNRNEQLAFYINAYNVLALKMVLDHWPVESIKDVGSLIQSVWNKPAGDIGGRPVTLDHVEHKILRPMGEPRIHLAIVCASVSCPDLRSEPYMAANLDTQLDDQVRRFLGNESKGASIGKSSLRVSKIFDWFGEDFRSLRGVDAFLRRYRPDLPDLPVATDLPYDWAINGMIPEK